MKRKATLFLLVLLAVAAVFIIGCAPKTGDAGGGQAVSAETSAAPTTSLLDDIVKRGALRIGMDTFVPWAMNDKNGELIGFEIDVAKKIAADMGVKAEFIPTAWSGIIPALLTGKFDIIIGGMGILPERNLKVNFSIPYDYSGMSIVANKDKAKGFASLEDFNKPEVIIAAKIGTTAAKAVENFMPKAQVKLFEKEPAVIQELLSGRVHAAVASAPLPAFTAIENPDKLFLPLKENFTREPIGFAVRKGDPDFLNFLDNWIIVNEASGFLKDNKTYWFETRDWADRIQ